LGATLAKAEMASVGGVPCSISGNAKRELRLAMGKDLLAT
jgi:hypothetical protein